MAANAVASSAAASIERLRRMAADPTLRNGFVARSSATVVPMVGFPCDRRRAALALACATASEPSQSPPPLIALYGIEI